jgi:hypothetical protein
MRLTMMRAGWVTLVGALSLPNVCCAQVFNDPFAQYVERYVTITPGAGNAADANRAIHTIDPWPAYAGYTHIPGNGRAAVDAVGRMYRNPSPFEAHPSGGAAVIGATTGGAGTGSFGVSTGMSAPGGGY